MTRRILLLSALICSVGIVSNAQQLASPCQQPVTYIGARDVVSPFPYQPLSVSVVAGQVSGAIVGTPVARPHLCLALFTERKHRFVMSVVTDDEGRFLFRDVVAGKYHLVVRAPGFYVTEIPVRVLGKAKGKTKESKLIDIVLQSPAMQR